MSEISKNLAYESLFLTKNDEDSAPEAPNITHGCSEYRGNIGQSRELQFYLDSQ
jgi:hypothetical protein